MNQKSRWWKAKSVYDQSDATGFIRLNALRLKLRAAVKLSQGVLSIEDSQWLRIWRRSCMREFLTGTALASNSRTLNHEEGAFTREAPSVRNRLSAATK
jgi:hypothetical protein